MRRRSAHMEGEVWNKTEKTAPWRDGTLLGYPEPYPQEPPMEWRSVEPFEAILYFENFQRGRSATEAIFVSAAGKRFPMFLRDLADVLLEAPPGGWYDGGVIRGSWTIAKRGQNYGIKRHKE